MKVLNQEKISLSLDRVSSCLGGGSNEYGLVELVKKCDHEFAEILKYLPENEELANRISSARYELEDIADSVNSIKENLYFIINIFF